MSWNIIFTSNNLLSNYLKCINFGFTIPTGASIMGIVVDVNYTGDGLGQIQDVNTCLVLNGVIQNGLGGTLNTNQTINPQNFIINKSTNIVSYGSQSSKWGLNPTTAAINTSNFGVALQYKTTAYTWNGSGQKPRLIINSITMKVYYSTGSMTSSVQENVLYGCKSSGRIYVLSEYVYYDYQDPILFVKKSGIITYQTLKNKRVDRLHLRIQKGVHNPQLLNYTNIGSFVAGNLYLTWDNDYKGEIQTLTNQVTIPINNSLPRDTTIKVEGISSLSATYMEVPLYRLGYYRARQYQLLMFDPVPFMFIEMEEEVTMLRD